MLKLEVTSDTTSLSYWLNWRFLLCAIWVLMPMIIGSLMIWKYERANGLKSGRGETLQGRDQRLRGNEAWKPSLKQVHPIWLLVFRVIAFCLLLATSISKVAMSGGHIFLYYTQWTLTLLTLYFGCGLLLSAYGCYQYMIQDTTRISNVGGDTEEGLYMPLMCEENTDAVRKINFSNARENIIVFRLPKIFTYLFEILFQINAGAVMLTDTVYWVIIFPFLTIQDYDPTFMTINMHTINLVLLLGETALNCLQVPFFRMSFFVIFTGVFVIFQWIVHACVSFWWPYPFLDLSSPYAPLWYLVVAVMHIPCYVLIDVRQYLLLEVTESRFRRNQPRQGLRFPVRTFLSKAGNKRTLGAGA